VAQDNFQEIFNYGEGGGVYFQQILRISVQEMGYKRLNMGSRGELNLNWVTGKRRSLHDLWISQVPLRLCFPSLFSASSSLDSSVSDNFDMAEMVWNINLNDLLIPRKFRGGSSWWICPIRLILKVSMTKWLGSLTNLKKKN
jgi:hypothetical protein